MGSVASIPYANENGLPQSKFVQRFVGGNISSAQAVLLGALAPGVNAPTWNTLKLTFLTLGICLAIMLGLPFSSSESSLILHVSFLVLIIVALFLLLNWFLEQTGLVFIEHQMQEMDLIAKDRAR
ncbi:uncharacterized protein LOC120139398 [Hibiscus syriacus]|uniref:uncharacterized protein LOC120139398 n=1 Tax=Hibiscus syriacus TaxID=106335 RepID=UPI001923BDD7|nr:uncharacterized protein LOC120139398 [Hibiscus syriacus]